MHVCDDYLTRMKINRAAILVWRRFLALHGVSAKSFTINELHSNGKQYNEKREMRTSPKFLYKLNYLICLICLKVIM